MHKFCTKLIIVTILLVNFLIFGQCKDQKTEASERFFDLSGLFNKYPTYNNNRPYYPGGYGNVGGYGGYGGVGGYGGYPQTGGGYYPNVYGTTGGGIGGYPGGTVYQGGVGGYPGIGGGGYGTNMLGGNGGYGGYGGNGGLPTYYGYNGLNYNGNRNVGFGYYKDTNANGLSRSDDVITTTGRRGYD